ncbi:MAG: VIT domain-containing protein [Armatimonadota bacterium]
MFRSLRNLILFSVLGALLSAAAPAAAQGLILPDRRLPIPNPRAVSVKSQHITMQVNSGAMRVEVEQVFYNPNPVPVEGTYLFPLPEGAVPSNFRLLIDKEPVDGKILTTQEARRIYEAYLRQNIDPAILEYAGRNTFRARVFPIAAGGERRIWMGYSQALEFNNGIYRAVYPLDSERVTQASAGDVTIDCTIRSPQPLKAVYSPTHEIHVKRESDHLARVTFEAKELRANRDFVLYYTTSEKAFGVNLLAHRKAGQPGYAMLMLAPKREVDSADVLPKDVVFVVDTSGSMQGDKIEQARKALQTVVGALNDKDRFNIIRFSSDVVPFRESVVPASPENRAAASAFVDQIKAVGGTAIDDALQAGLASLPKPEDRVGRAPFLVFVTDGLPTIGTTDVDQILKNAAKAAPADLRLFSFGVGADVNTLLLDRLARDNRGAADYISPSEDLETEIGSFYAKIANPVLSNVKVSVEGAKLTEVYPSKVPDLFAGTQLLLLGRYEGSGKGSVVLTGEVNGKPQRYSFPVELPERNAGEEFIPRLWAGRRIGFLLEEIRLNGEKEELKDEVIRLSKEWGIVTPYTSYLVEEPGALGAGFRTHFSIGGAEALGGGVGGGGFGGAAGRPGERGPAGPPGLPGPAGPPGARGATPPAASKPEAERVRRETAQTRARQQVDGYFNRSTGWNAVEASKRVRELKDRSVAEGDVEVRRTVEGRAFELQGEVWRDRTLPAKAKPVEVQYGSEAYFQLLRAKPEWAKFLALGRQVAFRTGKTAAVVIGPKGKTKLTEAELKALEK